MGIAHLTLIFLLALCATLATWLEPRLHRGQAEKGLLAGMMGESRRLFANHFFTRSDIYFHSGYYPSIFDEAKMEENHLAEGAGARQSKAEKHDHDEHDEHGEEGHKHDEHCDHEGEAHDFLGKPKDFMDGFSRNFFVSRHTHLTEKGPNASREILPWLKLAAELDPNKVETYTVAAYWLRDLGKAREAEEFLREGLRRNPSSYEILFELGRCSFDRQDFEHARNLWEMAMQRWREQENPKPVEQQNRFLAQQIVNQLARVEVKLGRREQAIGWLGIVKKLSPFPEEIEKRIQEVRAGETLDFE